MVHDGDTILLYPGVMTEWMVDLLMTLKSLTVVTNSMTIGRRFSRNANYTVILIGGQMRFDEDVLDGSTGTAMLQGLRVNKVFIECDGVSGAQGFACDDVASAHMKSAMVSCAQTVIVLARAQAIGRAAAVSFAGLNAVHHCITTDDAPADVTALLRTAGVRVALCGERLTEVCAGCRRTAVANWLCKPDGGRGLRGDDSPEH